MDSSVLNSQNMYFTCKVQYLDDTDPFNTTPKYPAPTRAPTFFFPTDVPLISQIPGIIRILNAPHKVEVCALQLCKFKAAQPDYGAYLDLDSSLDEQTDELEGFTDSKKNVIILRTQLSVRVNACIEKLSNSVDRELRRALFSLKQIFQEDKDLVHEFVTGGGLDCLIGIGSGADPTYQNYILKALGQIMLYVDGMNGVISHNPTLQWLYSLTSSKFPLLPKTALKLLLVFVEYKEENTLLLLQAISVIDTERGDEKICHNFMDILKDGEQPDSELLVYTMTLINKMLNAIPDQDLFYDVTDALEERGMEKIIKQLMKNPRVDADLVEQLNIYEAVLQHEDDGGISSSSGNIRKVPRVKSEEESRKSRRQSNAPAPHKPVVNDNMPTAKCTRNAEPPEGLQIIRCDARTDTTKHVESFIPHHPISSNVINRKPPINVIHSENTLTTGSDNASKRLPGSGGGPPQKLNNGNGRRLRKPEVTDRDVAPVDALVSRISAVDIVTKPVKYHPDAAHDSGEQRPSMSLLDRAQPLTWSSSSHSVDVTHGIGSHRESIPPSNNSAPLRLSQNAIISPPLDVPGHQSEYGTGSSLSSAVFQSTQPQPVNTVIMATHNYENQPANEDDDSTVNSVNQSVVSTVSEYVVPSSVDEISFKPSDGFLCQPVDSCKNNWNRNSMAQSSDDPLTGQDRGGQDEPVDDNIRRWNNRSSIVQSSDDTLTGQDRSSQSEPVDNNIRRWNRNSGVQSFDDSPVTQNRTSVSEVLNSSTGLVRNSVIRFSHDGADESNEGSAGFQDMILHKIKELTQLNANQSVSDNVAKWNRISINMPANDDEPTGPGSTLQKLITQKREELAHKERPSVTPQRISVIADVQKHVRSEAEEFWDQVENKMKTESRPLKFGSMDFSDLTEIDESVNSGRQLVHQQFTQSVPPPPPPMVFNDTGKLNAMPPPPPLLNMAPPNRSSLNATKTKKTMKLHWKEAKAELYNAQGRPADTIWSEMQRQIGSVSIDSTKLQHLFESRTAEVKTKDASKQEGAKKEVTLLETKRSNAINIGLTALPKPDVIKTAILKMDNSIINKEGIDKILTMMPTDEERNKIQEIQSSMPDVVLGSAEQFLAILCSIPQLEARLRLWSFRLEYENMETEIAEPLSDLMQGIKELRNSRTLKYILSTLLAIGNFLNGTEASGFVVDYLSHVMEVKDTVHKHSLLHHMTDVLIDQFPDATDLYSEIGSVTRCAKIEWDVLTSNLQSLESECKMSWDNLRAVTKHEGSTPLTNKLSDFITSCVESVVMLKIVYKRVLNRFRKFLLYFGFSESMAQEMKVEAFCKTVSDFALEYRTVRERLLVQRERKANQRERNKTRGKMIVDMENFSKKQQTKKQLPVVNEQEDDELVKCLMATKEGMGKRSRSKSRTRKSKEKIKIQKSVEQQIVSTDAEKVSAEADKVSEDVDKEVLDTSTEENSKPPKPPKPVIKKPTETVDTESLDDSAEDAILDALVKNVTTPSTKTSRDNNRRRVRLGHRQSLRRTLKSGLTSEEITAIMTSN